MPPRETTGAAERPEGSGGRAAAFVAGPLRVLGIDRAVGFGVLTRAWTAAAGPFTLLLIAAIFSPAVQGYHYTFLSLIALQAFLELGLGTVIVQVASHEWPHLRRDARGRVDGDARHLGRLAALVQFSLHWYAVAAAAAVLLLGTAGFVFFSGRPASGVAWQTPWIALCLAAALNLLLLPLWAILEGCDQVASVQTIRFFATVATTLVSWLAIAAGAGLWTSAAGMTAGFLVGLELLRRSHHEFLRSLLRTPRSRLFSWRDEVLPLQWRIAVSWLSGYFIYHLFTPVSFAMFGPVVAGRVGMTLALVSALASVSYMWVAVRLPTFGMLVARRDYRQLDTQFFRANLRSLLVAAGGAAVILGTVVLLNAAQHPLADRLLPPLPTALLLAASFASTAMWNMAAYLRAHKREPYMLVSVAGAAAIATVVVVAGRMAGVTGMAGGYLATWLVLTVVNVAVFRHCRENWHRPTLEAGPEAAQHA